MAASSIAHNLAYADRRSGGWAAPLVIVTGVTAALLSQGDRLLADPDTHWHLKVGADIWRDKALPWTDVYSHTFAGSPWIAKEWLAQLSLHAIHVAAGNAGLVLATALSTGLVCALMFTWLAARVRSTVALVAMLGALILIMPHILARPHIFAFLPMLLWTRGLVEAVDEDRAPNPWLLVALALWANLHNSFTIAYPIAALLALEALLSAPAERRFATVVRWGAFGLAALAAGCATPYGARPLLIAFTLFGSSEQLPFIHEWDPAGWGYLGCFAVASAALCVLALAFDGRRNSVRILLVIALTAMFIRHVRFLDVYAVVVPLIMAAPLARRFPAMRPEIPAISAGVERACAIGAMAASAVCAALLATSAYRQDPLVTPQAALDSARAAGVSGPVYNNYDYGGFLISRGVPTFVDGRTDQLFLGGFVGPLMRAIKQEDRAAFMDFIGRYGVTWAIVPSVGAEAPFFEHTPGWRRLYRDGAASVFVRD